MTRLDKRFDQNNDFPHDIFVIDPPGCGCTDCLMGYSTPITQVNSRDLAAAVCYLKMEVVDRTGGYLTDGLT